VQGIFVEKYDPTIECSYRKHVEVDGENCMVESTASTMGNEQFSGLLFSFWLIYLSYGESFYLFYQAMTDLYIKNAEGIIVMYSIINRQSFENIISFVETIRRIKDVDHSCKLPLILVFNSLILVMIQFLSFFK
jgi:GTPase SAR1 family protein